MALDFPANPTNGQTYLGYTYSSTTGAWLSNSSSVAPVYMGDVPPTNPTNGNMWFNTTDGTLYLYYYDGTSYQWVEARAPIVNDNYASPNYLINGGFDVWQRGTSSTSAGYQTADRWYGNAGATTTFAQEVTNVPTGFRYAYKMTLGATTACYVEQAIETSNAIQLAGQYATISAYMAGSVAQSVALSLYYSTSVDVGPSGSWTLAGSTTVSVGTNWSRYSSTIQVPASAKSLKVSYVQQGSNASGTVLYLAGAQFEAGTVATTFRRSGGSIQGELAACQRYFYNPLYGVTAANSAFADCVALGTGTVRFAIKIPTQMRAIPTLIGVTAGSYYFGYNTAGLNYQMSAIALETFSTSDFVSFNGTTSGMSAGTKGYLYRPDTSSVFGISAEL